MPLKSGFFNTTRPSLLRRFYTTYFARDSHAPPLHHTEEYLLLTRSLGVPDAGEQLRLPETDEEKTFLQAFARTHALDSSRPRVVIAPFTTWLTKEWEPERWAALMDWLVDKHRAQIVLTMAPSDSDRAAQMREMTSVGTRPSLTIAEGTTLRQYIALIRSSDLVVSPDSSALHIAAAVGTPSLTLFGPTNVAEIAPRAHPTGRVLRHPLPCSPCGSMQCANPVFRECMKSLTLDVVQEAVTQILAAAPCPEDSRDFHHK